MNQLFTIGHSNQSQEEFLAMLRRYGVDCVVDVRSVPASKYSPQFNMEVLRRFWMDLPFVFGGGMEVRISCR